MSLQLERIGSYIESPSQTSNHRGRILYFISAFSQPSHTPEMAPLPRSSPPASCGVPFDTTKASTFWALYLTDWILTILTALYLLYLIAGPRLTELFHKGKKLDKGKGREINRNAKDSSRDEENQSNLARERAKANRIYRISIGLTVFMLLLFGAQGFITRGATACIESPGFHFLGGDEWRPWMVYALQGAVAVGGVGGVWLLARRCRALERRDGSASGVELEERNEPRRDEDGEPVERSERPEAATADDRSVGNEPGPSRYGEPKERNGQSRSKHANPIVGGSPSVGRKEAPLQLPISQRCAQMAYGRTTSEVTEEDMFHPIRVSFPGPRHGNGEGSSKDMQRLAQLTAATSSQAADVQGFPFPPIGTVLERFSGLKPEVFLPPISERELARRNAIRRTGHTSSPRQDSGIVMGIERGSGEALRCPLPAPAVTPELSLGSPTTPAPAYTAAAWTELSTKHSTIRHWEGSITVQSRQPSHFMPPDAWTVKTAPPSPSMAPLTRCPRVG